MQSDYKQIYKITSKRTGKSEILYKDLGNFVFTELSSMLRRPKSLIIKLKGVGCWFLRRKRVDTVVKMFPPDYSLTKEDFETDSAFLKYENKKEVHEIFIERLKEYEEYIRLRDEIRKERYKNQPLLKPKRYES